jgi:hypothetical protein
MRFSNRAHGFVAPALLIVAIIAVLGHVCVLPGHAHVVPVQHHGSHDDAPADNAVHAASCDALKSTSAVLSIVPIDTGTPFVIVEPGSIRLFDATLPNARSESPPLFLLHAALLI